MQKIIISLILMLFSCRCYASEINNVSADEAMQKLKQGNEHFVNMHLKHPDASKKRRTEMLKGQHPFVAILSCSDSRIPPELVFDQGLGDIFEIRNAGNVLDDHVIGSVEYAVHHLGVKLVVVMGHQDCGAVKAAMQDSKESSCIESIKKSIQPAMMKAKKENKYSYENIIKNNAELAVEILSNKDATLREHIEKNGVKIIPAYYHLDSGRVEFLN